MTHVGPMRVGPRTSPANIGNEVFSFLQEK